MKITYIGHSCFKLESADGSAIFDPYEKGSVPGIEPMNEEADAVFCSHDHFDHNAAGEIRLTGNRPSYSVTAIESYHDDKKGSLRGPNTIRIIEAEGKRVAHMGDIGCELTDEQLAQLKNVDVLLIPVGGYYTIDDRQAAEMTAEIKPHYVVPMHYRSESFGFGNIGTSDNFENLVKQCEFGVEVLYLTPLRSSENGNHAFEI